MSLRAGGVSDDIDGDDSESLAPLEANPDAVGVVGLAAYVDTTGKLPVATMGGVPSTEIIASGERPVSRRLFMDVTAAPIGVIPGLGEYASFFVSDDVGGAGGPLAECGPASDPESAATPAAVADQAVMTAPPAP